MTLFQATFNGGGMMTEIVPTKNFKSGITSFDAPFWRGDTAEALIAWRKKIKASMKKGRRASTPRSKDDPQRTLRRLERALDRRKTEECRTRIRGQIEELQLKLGL